MAQWGSSDVTPDTLGSSTSFCRFGLQPYCYMRSRSRSLKLPTPRFPLARSTSGMYQILSPPVSDRALSLRSPLALWRPLFAPMLLRNEHLQDET